jgi:hypothetical protein
VDAKRRNEELGRNAPELLSCSFEGRVHGFGRWTLDGSSLFRTSRRWTVNIFLLFSLFQALFTRGAELASRSDTGLRKQTS